MRTTSSPAGLLLLVACFTFFLYAPAQGQIFETICRDANCTDVALGPLALIPQCYRTPQGSVQLSINSSDSDVLDLCFYLSDDCSDDNMTDTCHTFYNGEPCDCPFFRGLNDSLYVVFEWNPDTIQLLVDIIDLFPNFHRSRRQLFNNFFGLTEFGNWCGPGHGGTNDCCDDDPCPACNDTIGLTAECLDECPAEDDLDQACAVHDFCYGAHDYEQLFPNSDFECSSLFGIQKSGYCACDCELISTAKNITDSNDFYRSGLIFIFTHITNCWYNTTRGPVCNSKNDDRILVTEFC